MSTTQQNVPATQEVAKKDITEQVLKKVDIFKQSGALRIPGNYSPENALKSAYLILTDSKDKPLEKCTKESIANALLKMVVWGLSPLKKQCDFIPYGDKLDCTVEYTGNIALAKRFGNLKSVKANAIFKGDEFKFEIDAATGRKRIVNHVQTLESIGNTDILGAYAIYELNDGTMDTEIMNISQIKAAWNQGAAKGGSPAHKNFPDQMACKTVINRACKLLIRGSDDSVLFDEKDVPESDRRDIVDAVAEEIQENANAGAPLSFEPEPQPLKPSKTGGQQVNTGSDQQTMPGF
ncbi:MAG: recombinase RecT [Tannerella sp.]|jgi:recombination protein RecT|nr:recombinase RecT [Tannerella sp.]